MDPKPVSTSRPPNYPTRREVLAGAAAFAFASLGGGWQVFAATEDGKIVVAPIFEHGEGRGATGCIVLSPPVFLSEEEAMQVIREELGKVGVQLEKGISLKDTHISNRDITRDKNGKEHIEELKDSIKTEEDRKAAVAKHPARMADYLPGPLILNGLDAKKKIGVKFISEDHYAQSGGPLSSSTVQDYDFIEVAGYVAGKAKQSKEPIYLGIFYDPAVEWKHKKYDAGKKEKKSWKEEFEEEMKENKDESRKQLGKQVKDFVAWLKKQKVIDEPKAAK